MFAQDSVLTWYTKSCYEITHLRLSPWTQLPNNNNPGIWEDVPVWELFVTPLQNRNPLSDSSLDESIVVEWCVVWVLLLIRSLWVGCCCVVISTGGWLFVMKSFEQSMKLKNISFVLFSFFSSMKYKATFVFYLSIGSGLENSDKKK